MSDLKLTYYDYLSQHKDDPVRVCVIGEEEVPFLRNVRANEDGFVQMLQYRVTYRGISLRFVFDVFLDAWQEFYKAVNGQKMNIGDRFI